MKHKLGNESKKPNAQLLLGIMASATYLLVFLSHPSFFVWNTLNSSIPLIGWLQLASTIAWFMAMTLPLMFWIHGSKFSNLKSTFYLIGTLAWPFVLVVLHSTLYFFEGNAGMGYLIVYPIFFLTDIITPYLLFRAWSKFRNPVERREIPKNNFLFDSSS